MTDEHEKPMGSLIRLAGIPPVDIAEEISLDIPELQTAIRLADVALSAKVNELGVMTLNISEAQLVQYNLIQQIRAMRAEMNAIAGQAAARLNIKLDDHTTWNFDVNRMVFTRTK